MRDLIEQLVATGAVDALDPTDLNFPYLLRAIMLVRRGALHAAADDLARIQRWRSTHISLLRAGAAPEQWLNLFCEVYEHRFRGYDRIYDDAVAGEFVPSGGKDEMRLGLLWGTLLNDRAAGEDLGFLRRTLAAMLAPQIRRKGLSLSGEIACVLPEEFDVNVRLHIRVRARR